MRGRVEWGIAGSLARPISEVLCVLPCLVILWGVTILCQDCVSNELTPSIMEKTGLPVAFASAS